MQDQLAVARKHDATTEEIKTIVQRRCQYAQSMQSLSSSQTLTGATTNTPGIIRHKHQTSTEPRGKTQVRWQTLPQGHPRTKMGRMQETSRKTKPN